VIIETKNEFFRENVWWKKGADDHDWGGNSKTQRHGEYVVEKTGFFGKENRTGVRHSQEKWNEKTNEPPLQL